MLTCSVKCYAGAIFGCLANDSIIDSIGTPKQNPAKKNISCKSTNQHLLLWSLWLFFMEVCEAVGLFTPPHLRCKSNQGSRKNSSYRWRVITSWKLTCRFERGVCMICLFVCFYVWRINWRIFSISTVMMKSWKEYGILVDCFGMPWCPRHYMSRWKSPWPPPKRPQIATLPRLVKWKMDSSTTSDSFTAESFSTEPWL